MNQDTRLREIEAKLATLLAILSKGEATGEATASRQQAAEVPENTAKHLAQATVSRQQSPEVAPVLLRYAPNDDEATAPAPPQARHFVMHCEGGAA